MTHALSTKSYEEQKESGSVECWRKKVFLVFSSSVVGLSDRDVIEALRANDFNLVRPEITRLIQDGILIEYDKKKCYWTGKTVRVCRWSGESYYSRGNRTLKP